MKEKKNSSIIFLAQSSSKADPFKWSSANLLRYKAGSKNQLFLFSYTESPLHLAVDFSPQLPAMTVDNTDGNCRQIRSHSISKTSSCSSSFTFVESTISTTNSSLNSERCCPALVHVPTHVLSAITAHLDVVSRICLQGVNHHFRKVIEVDRAHLNACARYVLACHFSHGTSNNSLLTICGLCKTSRGKERYSRDLIRSIEDPRREPTSWTGHALARIPWVRPYWDWNESCLYRMDPEGIPNCYDHFIQKFSCDHRIESLMEFIEVYETRAAWLAFRVFHCTHCGKTISGKETRLVGCVDCKCDFCPQISSYQFRRCGPPYADSIHSTDLIPIPLRQVFKDPITKWAYAMEGYGKDMILVPVLFLTYCTDKTGSRSFHIRAGPDPKLQLTSRRDSQARAEGEAWIARWKQDQHSEYSRNRMSTQTVNLLVQDQTTPAHLVRA